MIEPSSNVKNTLSATEPTLESGAGPAQAPDPGPMPGAEFGQILSDQEDILGLLGQSTPGTGDEQEAPLPQGGTDLPETADIVVDSPSPTVPVWSFTLPGTVANAVPPAGAIPDSDLPALLFSAVNQSAATATATTAATVTATATATATAAATVTAEPVAAGPQPAAVASTGGAAPDLLQSLVSVKQSETAVGPLPQIDSPPLPGGERHAPAIDRSEAFVTTLGRMAGEGGIIARPVNAPLPALSLPPGQDGWSREVGDRVLWMVGRSMQSASLRVTPPQMGPIDIQLSLQSDEAHVSFTTHHAVVKEALEAAIPRLREMFGQNDLQLVSVDVGQRGQGDSRPMAERFTGQGEAGGSGQRAFGSAAGPGEEPPAGGVERYYQGSGLLDDFA